MLDTSTRVVEEMATNGVARQSWWRREQAGQAVVEFAFVSLVLLLMTFGTIDLGRGVFARSMLTNAVREGARYGSVNPSDTNGIIAAAAKTSPSLNLSASNVVVTCYTWPTGGVDWVAVSCGSTKPGDRIEVHINYLFGLTAPRLIGITSINMSETARMTIE